MSDPATVKTVAYSDFLRKSTEVVAYVDGGEVVELARRDGPNLRVQLADRADEGNESIALVAQILLLAMDIPRIRADLEPVLIRALPWIEFLPADEQTECMAALLRRLQASAETGVLGAFAQLVHEWRGTAAVYADAELIRELTRPIAGDGPALFPPA